MQPVENSDYAAKHRRPFPAMFVYIKSGLWLVLLIGLVFLGRFFWERHALQTDFKLQHPSGPVALPASATVAPVSIDLPTVNIAAPIVAVALDADGSLQIPADENAVGWYIYSPVPGNVGPAILDGHLDSATATAVFSRLKDLKAGDEIDVTRSDRTAAVFKVDSLKNFSQFNFPTSLVYGPITTAGLRLITCSGSYSLKYRRYSDNLVVYATLQNIVSPH